METPKVIKVTKKRSFFNDEHALYFGRRMMRELFTQKAEEITERLKRLDNV